jgi:predicted anti-sigma-YlaC factor YlaD
VRAARPAADVSCQEIVELVSDFMEGALDPVTAGEVDAHLRLCGGCAEYVEQMRRTVASLGRVPVETLSPEAKAALLTAFRDYSRPGGQRL